MKNLTIGMLFFDCWDTFCLFNDYGYFTVIDKNNESGLHSDWLGLYHYWFCDSL
ncbi:hypothetical protein OL548_18905 [Lysinibacillus sp. MHQ-1]|nr:hypothetical protein OL548_18905 [Lysinibacillus sp. MHQ-1]